MKNVIGNLGGGSTPTQARKTTADLPRVPVRQTPPRNEGVASVTTTTDKQTYTIRGHEITVSAGVDVTEGTPFIGKNTRKYGALVVNGFSGAPQETVFNTDDALHFSFGQQNGYCTLHDGAGTKENPLDVKQITEHVLAGGHAPAQDKRIRTKKSSIDDTRVTERLDAMGLTSPSSVRTTEPSETRVTINGNYQVTLPEKSVLNNGAPVIGQHKNGIGVLLLNGHGGESGVFYKSEGVELSFVPQTGFCLKHNHGTEDNPLTIKELASHILQQHTVRQDSVKLSRKRKNENTRNLSPEVDLAKKTKLDPTVSQADQGKEAGKVSEVLTAHAEDEIRLEIMGRRNYEIDTNNPRHIEFIKKFGEDILYNSRSMHETEANNILLHVKNNGEFDSAKMEAETERRKGFFAHTLMHTRFIAGTALRPTLQASIAQILREKEA